MEARNGQGAKTEEQEKGNGQEERQAGQSEHSAGRRDELRHSEQSANRRDELRDSEQSASHLDELNRSEQPAGQRVWTDEQGHPADMAGGREAKQPLGSASTRQPESPMDLAAIAELGQRVKANVAKVVVGKEEVVEQLLIALLASGHVLLEDVPGTGKTLLAKSLARSLDTAFSRVQFTPDLLPTDVSGVTIFDMKSSEFVFRPGPVFTNVLLADEINRATPRTQAVLLECMEERQVTIDGVTRPLERPFLVIATENPLENQGTFPLPEAQLDRFMLKVGMGYPNTEESIAILRRFRAEDPLAALEPVAEAAEIRAAQAGYTAVEVHEDLYGYIVALAEESRRDPDLLSGVSPRGCLSMLRAAQARAVLAGRTYVSPDDVKALAVPVWAHRVLPARRGAAFERVGESVIRRILERVPVPTEPADRLTGRG